MSTTTTTFAERAALSRYLALAPDATDYELSCRLDTAAIGARHADTPQSRDLVYPMEQLANALRRGDTAAVETLATKVANMLPATDENRELPK